MSNIGFVLGIARMFATEMKVGRALKEQELIERYKLALKMPRKKKKREKKDILLTWSIVTWDPLGIDQFSYL